MLTTTTQRSQQITKHFQPGWNSAFAFALVIIATNYPQYWALWAILALIALAFFSRTTLLISALCIAMRIYLEPPSPTEVLPSNLTGTVTECVRATEGFRYVVEFESGNAAFVRFNAEIRPGAHGTFTMKWDSPRPQTIPGAFNSKQWLKNNGVQASGKLLTFSEDRSSFCLGQLSYAAREWLRELCGSKMGGQGAGLMVALLVGDKSGLEESTSQDFRNTGLVHILTVSGFHIVFLSSFLQMLLAAFRIPRRILGWITIILLALFIPITGSSPAVQRAVLMFFIMHTATILERTPLSLHSLGVASSLILLWEPGALWDIGFQLSCGATAGILLGQKQGPQFASFQKALNSWVLEPSWITVCATIGTFPFLVFHFQSFPPIAFLGNLIVAPLMGLAMEAGVLLVLFFFLSPVACGFGQAASVLLGFSTTITNMLANGPGAGCTIGPWPIPICLCWLVGGFLLLRIKGASKLQHSLILFCSLTWMIWSIMEHPQMKIHILDADQGDCIVLHFPNGKGIVIDAGNAKGSGQFGKRSIVPFLRSQGISQIDALIITHPDLDHYGGALSLIENYRVRSLWIPPGARFCPKADWAQFLSRVAASGIPIHSIYAGMAFNGLGDYRIRFLWAGEDPDTEDWNSLSAGIVLSHGSQNIFTSTGDLPASEEETLVAEQLIPMIWFQYSAVLKLGHHGSKTSSSELFLDSIHSQFAIISVGKGNRYGHPHQETLQRLRQRNIPMQSTSEAGTISIEEREDTLYLSGYRDSLFIFSLPFPVRHR